MRAESIYSRIGRCDAKDREGEVIGTMLEITNSAAFAGGAQDDIYARVICERLEYHILQKIKDRYIDKNPRQLHRLVNQDGKVRALKLYSPGILVECGVCGHT
jgi:hypothetical protein